MDEKEITVQLPTNLYREIQQEAEQKNISIQDSAIFIMEKGLNAGTLTKQFSLEMDYLLIKFKKFLFLVLLIFLLIQAAVLHL
ncbi:hypothetical protein QQG09_08875 [Melissococcus plutonius]|uniref:hypothetical protein n=1 Tax=Melissococcus plutonius TaxID=33970 RepID=UPI0021E5F2C0|nr:hypothetical protein [Melissococcus plutonius]MCV2501984.1 hypothetical protein [Melissococcus plutonius]MCV2505866.1 hypothetical protein [Melissococcus plutonius]MCV2520632.1 hypothetical protein [Melissococcus plutonius]